jgi:hypothetical protein
MPTFKHIATIAIVVVVVIFALKLSPFRKTFGLES